MRKTLLKGAYIHSVVHILYIHCSVENKDVGHGGEKEQVSELWDSKDVLLSYANESSLIQYLMTLLIPGRGRPRTMSSTERLRMVRGTIRASVSRNITPLTELTQNSDADTREINIYVSVSKTKKAGVRSGRQLAFGTLALAATSQSGRSQIFARA